VALEQIIPTETMHPPRYKGTEASNEKCNNMVTIMRITSIIATTRRNPMCFDSKGRNGHASAHKTPQRIYENRKIMMPAVEGEFLIYFPRMWGLFLRIISGENIDHVLIGKRRWWWSFVTIVPINTIRTSYVLRLIPPQAIGNAGQRNYCQGVDFEKGCGKVLDPTGDKLKDEPCQLQNGDSFG
jgi:hypothetical protein